MIKLTLPHWLSGEQLAKLKRACQRYWETVEGWVTWPLAQLDVSTCSVGVLSLVAWQRAVDRFPGEPLSLYRLRVKHAFINAKDAGSVAGVKRIFERLGIGYVEIEERLEGLDWDIIKIVLSDSQLSQNPELLNIIIQKYGRTCRRYTFEVITPVNLIHHLVHCGHDNGYSEASLP